METVINKTMAQMINHAYLDLLAWEKLRENTKRPPHFLTSGINSIGCHFKINKKGNNEEHANIHRLKPTVHIDRILGVKGNFVFLTFLNCCKSSTSDHQPLSTLTSMTNDLEWWKLPPSAQVFVHTFPASSSFSASAWGSAGELLMGRSVAEHGLKHLLSHHFPFWPLAILKWSLDRLNLFVKFCWVVQTNYS